MTPKEKEKRLLAVQQELAVYEAEQNLRNVKSSATRSRSITVGTVFGGTTEISMRGEGSDNLWCIMQPVEVIELIHQLASNVGCNVHVQPRQDFASWRQWALTDEERRHANGHPPFVNDMAPFNQLGISGVNENLISSLETSGFQGEGGGRGGIPAKISEEDLYDAMATKKNLKRRKLK